MSAEVMVALGGEGYLVEPGLLGEQLILSGIDVNALPVGSRIQIGGEACIELTEPRTGCAKFERYQEKSPQGAAGRLGMMARVVSSGAIAVGDAVQVVSA
jgi:MOSC domain-containing protein YiiM